MLLSVAENQELENYEKTILDGLDTFYNVGMALLAIRDKKLYRKNYDSFEEYCRDRWNISNPYAYRLMSATTIVDNLSTTSTPPPVSEYVVRPLNQLEPEQQREAWTKAVDTAPKGYPTAGHVQRIVDEIKSRDQYQNQTIDDVQPDNIEPDSSEDTESSLEPSPDVETESQPEQSIPLERKPLHTDNVPVSVQFHNKFLWNYARINMKQFDAFTIGYSQRTGQQVVELLQLASVEVLIDSRKNPVSQYKPDFNKSALAEICASSGIHYVHAPELGIDSSQRSDLHKTHNYADLWENYEHAIDVNNMIEYMQLGRVAFLCLELDPTTCHRHRIALLLEAKGYKMFDL